MKHIDKHRFCCAIVINYFEKVIKDDGTTKTITSTEERERENKAQVNR